MGRFPTNRWWTFILALCLTLTCFAAAAAPPAHADGNGDPRWTTDDDPVGWGDPDIPDGPGKSGGMVMRGAMQQERGTTTVSVRTVGDGRVSDSVWMWRLRLALMSLKGFYFRF